MSGECLVEHVQRADDDDPENDDGGNAFLLDDFLVEAFVRVPVGILVAHMCSNRESITGKLVRCELSRSVCALFGNVS